MTRTPQARRVAESLYDGPSRAYESDSDIARKTAVMHGIDMRMRAADFQGVTLSGALRDFQGVPEDADDYAECEQLCAVLARRLVERQKDWAR